MSKDGHVRGLIDQISNTVLSLEQEKITKNGSLFNNFFGWISRLVLREILDDEVNELVMIIQTSPKEDLEDSLNALLVAGEILFDVERLKDSEECFIRILELNDNKDQDIRLLSLMGRLEAIVAQQLTMAQKHRDEFFDEVDVDGLEELQMSIVKDLNLTTTAVGNGIRKRLSWVKIRIGMLCIFKEVELTRDAYKNREFF